MDTASNQQQNGRIMYKDIMCCVAVLITLSCMVALMIGNSTMLAVCGILYMLVVLAGIISLFFDD